MVRNFKLLALLLLLSTQSFARKIEGVITVLEAPMFRVPSSQSKVIQHLRKGDTIYLHPSTGKQKEYEHLRPTEEEEIKFFMASEQDYQKQHYDKFIEEDLYIHDEGNQFVKTIDKRGRDAYVLREHIFIYYQDDRELTQKVVGKDPTDYRLHEPLPKTYPYYPENHGFRGFISFGLGTQNKTNYPYNEDVSNQGYTSSKEVNFLWSRRAEFDKFENRYYWGTLVSISSFENQFELQTRNSTEQWFKLGVGPAMTYDLWRQKGHSIVGVAGFLINIVNTNKVTQQDENTLLEETRTYKGISLAPKLAAYYKLDKFLAELDFIAGLSLQSELPYNIKSSKTTDNPSWWRSKGSDSFQIEPSFEMALFLGFQSSL